MTWIAIAAICLGVGGAVGGGAVWKYGGNMKQAGGDEVRVDYHETESVKRTVRNRSVREFQMDSLKENIELDHMAKDGVDEAEMRRKAFSKWGKH